MRTFLLPLERLGVREDVGCRTDPAVRVTVCQRPRQLATTPQRVLSPGLAFFDASGRHFFLLRKGMQGACRASGGRMLGVIFSGEPSFLTQNLPDGSLGISSRPS